MADLDQHLAAIQAGDPVAFGWWIAGAEPRLRDSLRPVAARVDVEAVVQEALLRVWQVAPRFVADGRPDGLVRLAIRVARNLAIDELRRVWRVDLATAEHLERALAAEAEAQAHRTAPDPMLRSLIAACRALLRGKPAEALGARLASGGGDDDEALAARLGMRVNTFLQNFTRARQQLAACLKKRGVEVSEHLG